MSLEPSKKALSAFLLSLLTPGLGQIYNGQLAKGVLCVVGLSVLSLVSISLGVMRSFDGLIVYFALGLLLYLAVLGDAVYTAAKQVRLNRRPVHTWRSYVLGALLFLTAIFGIPVNILVKLAGVHAYKMDADSMLPTLASNDRIVADTKFYNSHPPRRGDVVVFVFPYSNHPIYAKRIIGEPGDRIKIVEQQVYVNDERQNEPFVHHDPDASFDPFANTFPAATADELSPGIQPEWAQQIFGDVHNGEMIVPPDTYFMLGDNREHSWDSRYWGPVARDKIFGKALYIYWSDDKSRIGRAIR